MRYEILSRSDFYRRGGDVAVYVLEIPDGAEVPINLNLRSLKKRGIRLHCIGYHYYRSVGSRARLMQKAEKLVEKLKSDAM